MTRSIISKRRRRRLRGKVHGLFGPRSDLPAAESVPVLKRGSIGRRAIALGDMPEDHLRMIEKALAESRAKDLQHGKAHD